MLPETAAAVLPRPSTADGLTGRQHALALAAILLSVAMATLDTAIANTALPTIATSLRVSEAQVIWVVNAYQLAMVAALLPFAASGEVLGHRRVFAAGTLLFTVASLVCGLADSLTALVAARVLQGLGGAAIMSVNMTLIRVVFPARRLGRGAGMNALVVGLAFTVGPTVASAVLAVATWHWLFLVNVPVGVVAVLFAAGALPHTERHHHGFDRVAALLCAGLFGCAVLGFETLSHGGAWVPVCVELAVAATCGTLLWRRQAGHPAPMLPVDLLRSPAFSLSALTAICAFSAQSFGFVALPFLLQSTLGYSAVATGLLMTPWPAVVALMAPIAGPLADRHPPGLLGGIGLVVFSVGLGALALLPAHAAVIDIAWRTAVCGAGFGLFQAPNLKALMGSVPARRSGSASGVVATSRLLGQTLGAGLVALCFHLGAAVAPALALWLGCAFALAGSAASVLRLLPAVSGGPTASGRR
ncbi:MAG: MFS transporter [Burkholderiales bacterium]|nr:MFS transporter [Burkholderiales bacterium]